jgi:protein-tyrosine phosphatase
MLAVMLAAWVTQGWFGMSILFVCLGNICRSPLVAAVARKRFAEAGWSVEVDSCGTGDWHVGEGADSRSIAVAETAGYALREHRVRQLCDDDYAHFDWLLAMDGDNLAVLRRRCPQPSPARLQLFLDAAGSGAGRSVPDPYQGGLDDFRAVLKLAEQGVDGLLQRMRTPPGAASNAMKSKG